MKVVVCLNDNIIFSIFLFTADDGGLPLGSGRQMSTVSQNHSQNQAQQGDGALQEVGICFSF